MEGVMMRGERSIAMAVRRPNGEIDLTTKPLPNIFTGNMRKIPLVRGVIVLAESLVLGVQALLHSANVALEEEEEEMSGPLMWVVLAFSMAFAIGLFFVVPLLLAELLPDFGLPLAGAAEGVLRIVIFGLYLGAMNLIPSIRSVFAFHGAEHKTINAYEDGAPMEVGAVKRYSTAHLRCGTSFLLTVLIIAIILFTLVGEPALWLRIVSRIVLVPFIAGLAYEVTRFSATYEDNPVIHAFFWPGLALQTLTTRQPNDSQIEVGICALQGAIQADGAQE